MSWLDDLDSTPEDPSDPREKMDLPPELAGAIALMAPMGRALKAAQQTLIDAGFTDDQAFKIMFQMCILNATPQE